MHTMCPKQSDCDYLWVSHGNSSKFLEARYIAVVTLKFAKNWPYCEEMSPKNAHRITNCVDHDQTAPIIGAV